VKRRVGGIYRHKINKHNDEMVTSSMREREREGIARRKRLSLILCEGALQQYDRVEGQRNVALNYIHLSYE
jgi:hypothetical protein